MVEARKYSLLAPVQEAGQSDLLASFSTEVEGVERIRLFLADWLRMENVVVLAGAGCSVCVGGSVVTGKSNNSLEKKVIDAVECCDLSEGSRKIIEARKTTESNSFGFETWLSYLFAYSRAVCLNSSPIATVSWKAPDSDGGLSDQVVLSKQELIQLCSLIEKSIFFECDLCLPSGNMENGNKFASGHMPFVAKLVARDAALGRVHLATLNYDTLFEQALERLGILYIDGFAGKIEPQYTPEMYDFDIHFPGEKSGGRVMRIPQLLHFCKLHGSVNWAQTRDGIFRKELFQKEISSQYRDSSALKKAELLERHKLAPYAILPTMQKFVQTLAMPFGDLFRSFRDKLNQPQTFLLVIGYGFGDEHINMIIKKSLANPSLIMLVVDPKLSEGASQLLQTYQRHGRRVFVLTGAPRENEKGTVLAPTFEDFAQNIMPNVRWLTDYIRIKKLEREILQSGSESFHPRSWGK